MNKEEERGEMESEKSVLALTPRIDYLERTKEVLFDCVETFNVSRLSMELKSMSIDLVE